MTTADRSSFTVLGGCPHDCPDTCSMVITVEDGRVSKVRGNPDHPFTKGGLCVKVTDYPNHVYSTDRLLHPMRRTGPKGSGEFEQITWDEALDEIAERFTDVIDTVGAKGILPYSYLGQMGVLNGMTVGDPFFNALGTSVTERTFCDGGAITAYVMTLGPTAGVDPESLVHSKYIIIWACNVLSNNLHLQPFIDEAQKNGAKVVCIDPVAHRTAKKADWHIPIRPGTDGALAMAMMHVIIDEGLTDAAFVVDHTVGYDELAAHVQQYTPEWAEVETGIAADDIRTLAREYAAAQPAMIRVGVGIERHPGGGQACRAIFSLPALVGAWRQPGGGVLQMPVWAFPMNWEQLHGSHADEANARAINQWRLGPALTGEMELDPPINALMVYNSNPAVVSSDQAKILEGLAREDLFTVVHEQFMTDTARYADIVLPATTQVEQTDLMYSWGHLYWAWNPKVIEPLGEAVSNNELFRRLAARMGIDDPWFSMDDEEQLLNGVDWSAPQMEGITLDRLKEEGWLRLNLPGADDYAPHADGGFLTPSGKVELVASMAAGGNFVAPLFRQGTMADQDGSPVEALPTYTPPSEIQSGTYPLALISPKAHAFLNSQYGNMDKQLDLQGQQTVTLHPDDASSRGVSAGDSVRVFNDRGTIQAEVKVSEDVRPGVAIMPVGHWPSRSDGGLTVNALTNTAYADIGRAPTFSDTAVEVAAT